MNFDFLSQTIPEQSPNLNHQSSFSTHNNSNNNEEFNQLISPNPNNTNGFQSSNNLSTFDFLDYLSSNDNTTIINNKIDGKLEESFPPQPPYLQTPKTTTSPTFLNQQPLIGTSFLNQSTPAILSNSSFLTSLQQNNLSQININTKFSPINSNFLNVNQKNSNNSNNEISTNTPNSVLGLNNSPQQFTPPNNTNDNSQMSSANTSIAENPSPTIGLGLNTATANQQVTDFDQMNHQQPNLFISTPTQQRFPPQSNYNHNQNLRRTSPITQNNLTSPNQYLAQQPLPQQQQQQVAYNLNSYKAQSESNLNLQKLWQQQLDNSFEYEDYVQSINGSLDQIPNLDEPMEEPIPNSNIKNELSSPILEVNHMNQSTANDSPTTIEITSPQSSDDELTENKEYGHGHNITAEELLSNDIFDDLKQNSNDTFNEFVNIKKENGSSQDVTRIIKIEETSPKLKPISTGEPTKIKQQKSTSTILPRRKKNSVSGPASSSKSNSNKKVLKKSSSFNGTSTLLINPKIQWTKNQTTTTTSPTTSTFKTSRTNSSSTSKRSLSNSNNHIDLINSMPVFTSNNHYSFVYENVDTIYQEDLELNSTNKKSDSTNSSSATSLATQKQNNLKSSPASKNLKSGLIEFQIELKK
ncbi:hypothetical protein KGF54_003116 [Candida jiufengensis]|uniref:uncharacterized protein n=1 Tax=Candida jiufengensis TaxID=497108 RepID=UPI002224EB56|nr:uncharacterized protein KGF54_003116 [Candida jiufengensis]KAI5952250.1 hypothetical protein KGF54_003116 [Candida jiufengensis]